ncbi:hypothetical protein LINPERPRIM_LOCUS27697 [Linum perenne]
MNKYYIGEIDPETVPTSKKYNTPLLQLLLPLIVLGVAFSARSALKKD